ncbi:hypothetical protein FACS189440_06340 [Bacteroidia bacterium]|nr:hypothetical protein FACS189440_06340 [Bacteroidia bacterium]
MKTHHLFYLLVGLSFLFCSNTDIQAAGKLRAGSAKINITPPSTRYPVHDSLYARSLILDAGSVRIGFLTYDSGNGSDAFIESLKKKFNLNELFFCQSHDHSGASGTKEWTEANFTKVLDEASKNMFDATLSGGHRSFPSLSFNRLIVRDDGHARESWFADDHYRYINRERLPHGPVDNSVGVIRIDDANGNPRILIMNYACHPDVIWNNFEVSGDYVGYATRYTEEAFGNKIHCLFVNGAAGNQAPLFKDGGRQGPDDPRKANYDLIERMGKLLSIETVKLAKELYPNPYDEASVKVKTDSLTFTGRFDKTQKRTPHFSVVAINNRYVFSVVPGEFFIKFQLDWKNELSQYGLVPFFFGYATSGGSSPGYVPDVRSSALGGFGADQGGGQIEVGAGERVMIKQLENYYILSGLMRDKPGPGEHRLDDGTILP